MSKNNATAMAPAGVQKLTDEIVFSLYRYKEADSCTCLSPEQLQQLIVNGRYTAQDGNSIAYLTREARRQHLLGNSKEYNHWKMKAPAVTPAVVCHPCGGHRQQNIAGYTGLLMFDFDHIEEPQQLRRLLQVLRRQPYTFAVWTTTSGNGVRLIVRYRPDEGAQALLREEYGGLMLGADDYKNIWLHVRARVETLTGLKVDPITKDPTRLSFLCHDAEAYFDLSHHSEHNSVAIGIEVLHPLPPARSMTLQLRDTAGAVLPHELADTWMQRRGEHYHEGCRNRYLFAYACCMCRLGADMEACRLQAGMMTPPLDEREIAATIASAYRTVQGSGEEGILAHKLRTNEAPRIAASSQQTAAAPKVQKGSRYDQTAQVVAYIEEHYLLRHNKLNDAIEICKKEHAADHNPLMHPYRVVSANGRVISSLWHEVNRTLGINFSKKSLYDLLYSDAVSGSYNPIDNYLEYCKQTTMARYAARPQKEWHTNPIYEREDGTAIATPWSPEEDEIGKVFAAIRSNMPGELLHWIGAKWLVGLAASVLNPTLKGHFMLILQGKGGTGKTNFLKSLAPPHAKETNSLLSVTTMARFGNKHEAREMGIMLSKSLLVLVDEFSQPTANEINILKETITSTQIDKRFLFTDDTNQLERRCTLCGTTNDSVLMNEDLAEQRRLIPIHVESIAHYGILSRLPIDPTLLYGQAVWLYLSGMKHWLTPHQPDRYEQMLYGYTNMFSAPRPETEYLQTYFFPPQPDTPPCDADTGLPLPTELLNATEILGRISTRTRIPYYISNRNIKQALIEMGYPQKTVKGKRGFLLIEKPYCNQKEEALQGARESKNEPPAA